MKLIPELRAVAVDYQRLLVEWIADLRRRNLRVTSQPYALVRVLAWLRACDAGTATLDEYVQATQEASRACDEARRVASDDNRMRAEAREGL